MFFVDSNSPRLFIFARVCFRIWWFGKQMWGGVLGFVVGFTLMGNKCGEVFLALWLDVVVW